MCTIYTYRWDEFMMLKKKSNIIAGYYPEVDRTSAKFNSIIKVHNANNFLTIQLNSKLNIYMQRYTRDKLDKVSYALKCICDKFGLLKIFSVIRVVEF